MLVADDDPDNAELLAFILADAGADIRTAHSASEVLELVGSGWKPDVALLDIGLPDMDGYRLLREIRNVPGLGGVPAVAVTGHAYERDRTKAVEAGFTVHVTKPYDGEAVVHLVAALATPRPQPGRRIIDDVRSALAKGGVHAALAVLNKGTDHRFTGVYRFDGEMLRNVCLFDRQNPTSVVGDDAPLRETYCSIVGRGRVSFVSANTVDDARLTEHPARLSVQSYCGVLLRNADATPFGSLCHFDLLPVEPLDDALDLLEGVAPLITYLLAADG